MFKTGIKPAWEDEMNKNGSEFRIDLGYMKDPEKVQIIWETLVFDIVTGNMPHIEKHVAGVKLNQKTKGNTLNSFRFELWLLSDQEKCAENEEIKRYLETRIIGELLKDTNVKDA